MAKPKSDLPLRQYTETQIKTTRVAKGLRQKGDPHSNQVPMINESDCARITSHSLELAELPRVDFDKPETVEKNCKGYFGICNKYQLKPTIAGLALAVGLSRVDLLYAVSNPDKWNRNANPESIKVLKKYHQIINSQMEILMQEGKIQPLAGIFLMKNNMQYSDKTEYVITPNAQNQVDTQKLIEQAQDLPEE